MKKDIDWANTAFLSSTFLTAVLGVPAYIWFFGIDAFQITLFFLFFIATGLSITLGYHRLFSHLTFQARMPVRLFTLLFGAAAFENSALRWCADHRRHHKFAGHDDDPYDIEKGFWHAHIGWIMFRQGPETPLTWVRDLQKDPLVRWQHRYCVAIGLLVGLVLPALLGLAYGGWRAALGSFLIAGVARVVAVHHMTFCINSLCHWTGKRPYSSKSSARDSFLMALFTFGEGYHNYHHEFQHDYRNGVKFWQFDPTKWTIRVLQFLGLVRNLRTVPSAKILQAEITEQQRQLEEKLSGRQVSDPHGFAAMLQNARAALDETFARWAKLQEEYRELKQGQITACKVTRERIKRQLREESSRLASSLREWRNTCFQLNLELS